MDDHISIVPAHLIHNQKWDDCIATCGTGLVYAFSDYLNALADDWLGIVFNDYEAVMPVAIRKKAGIKYAYDVPFLQQSGIYGRVNAQVNSRMAQRLLKVVAYGWYNFNYTNPHVFNATACNNYILPLNTHYEKLEEHFSTDVKQNIRKALQNDLHYQHALPEEAINLYFELYKTRFSNLRDADKSRFLAFACKASEKWQILVRKVCNSAGQTLSVALLIKDQNRLYNLMNSTTSEGRKKESNYLLFHQVFKEFENSGLVFDFEGSDIPGIENFYKKFGAVNQPYQRIKINRLPWPLRWLKR